MNGAPSALAGLPAPAALRVDIGKLLAAYEELQPDPTQPGQRVAFGTSGHRGVSFTRSFNEWHVLAITQAICDWRRAQGIDGPLFVGIDTHALSLPTLHSALEVLAANAVETLIAPPGVYTPTPAVSLAILMANRGRTAGLGDGIVITPSHNPPEFGGFKYNPPHGGPAGTATTRWIEQRANALLLTRLRSVRRMPLIQALRQPNIHEHDFLDRYIGELDQVVDLAAIGNAGLRMAVDPLGGAGVHYWTRIAERYCLDLSVVSEAVDPQFGFMTVDRDGQIRMDPASPYAMQRLIQRRHRYDIAFACDTDHDRHGIVTPGAGLLPANHYLSVLIDYLFRHRPRWPADAAIGKTVVSSALIDRVTARLGRRLFEVPVGFKWFSAGLLDGRLGFAGEESAGASFSRIDGSVWTTDKDGIVAALLSAEITARCGRDPGVLYRELASELGRPMAKRIEAPANATQNARLAALSPRQLTITELAGERIDDVLDHAPGNGAEIGGIKVVAASGWFAARPSGTEALYKIYAESFHGNDHLQALLRDAQRIVDAALHDSADDHALRPGEAA